MTRWYLEGYFDGSKTLRKVPIEEFPFTIGRAEQLGLTIDEQDVSRRHAELFKKNGQLYIRDLGSTNGTFVNHHKISKETPINGDDVIHFAHIESRLSDPGSNHVNNESETMFMSDDLPDRIPMGASDLKAMIEQKMIKCVFQPVVDMNDAVVAFEILGRGAHPGLPKGPIELFRIAESVGLEIELSELFRSEGLKQAATYNNKPILVNMHPKELEEPGRLLAELERVAHEPHQFRILLEIHEQAVTDLAAMQMLSSELDKLHMGIAYDDFGAGQTRLLELSAAPPEIVKFDIELIRDIDKVDLKRQQMLKMLVAMVHHMGVKALAEGVSREGEANVIKAMGFDLIQGFYYGQPLSSLELKD